MTKIIPVDPAQNIYENSVGFKRVDTQNVLFEGRTVEKITYRDAYSLIWKIGQVALAVLITLATLGLAFCFQKGMIWKEALAQFKDRIVYQNVAVQPVAHALIPSSSKPLDVAGTIPTPNGNVVVPSQNVLPSVLQTLPAPIPVSMQPSAPAPATIVPVAVPPLAPPVVTAAPLSPANFALLLKKEGILKENPEYGNAVQAWEKAGVSLADQLARLEELKQYAFGTDKWVKYYGEIVGAVPPLPEDIAEICNSNDHSKPGEKVKDTHVLVLVPKAVMVNGKPTNVTLKSLGELVKAPKGSGHKTHYLSNVIYAKGHENTPVAKSHWVLMKKEVILGSRNQTFAKQVEMVKEYSKKANVQYSVPNAIDAAACCFMNFVNSGTRLFDSKGPDDLTYTRCQELVEEKYPIVVGGFAPGGLLVSTHGVYGLDYLGVGALRKF